MFKKRTFDLEEVSFSDPHGKQLTLADGGVIDLADELLSDGLGGRFNGQTEYRLRVPPVVALGGLMQPLNFTAKGFENGTGFVLSGRVIYESGGMDGFNYEGTGVLCIDEIIDSRRD